MRSIGDFDATMPASPGPHDSGSADVALQRRLGRFRLLGLEGRSQRTMAWRVNDPLAGDERLLLLPARPPRDEARATRWLEAVRRGARLDHPRIAAPVEVDRCGRWPYALVDCAGRRTVAQRLREAAPGAAEAVRWLAAALEGIAFAHDAGIAHHDLQPYLLLVDDGGAVHLAGVEVGRVRDDDDPLEPSAPRTHAEALDLNRQRAAAQRDVLAAGVLLHRILAGRAPFDDDDVGRIVERIAPGGAAVLRLPWQTPHPVPDALRAIANRSTDRQLRLRYGSARGLRRALEGWLAAEQGVDGGTLALLADRLHAAGVLPAAPGSAERAARLALMDRQRTNELAQVVLEDLALSFEMLRAANGAQARALVAPGSGAVLTVRRAIAMLGLDGVRRAALGLRPWPGPLDADAARGLRRLVAQSRRAARVAEALRPAAYDAEVVCLITLLQNLGRLLVAYHFPDEWRQICQLSAPAGDEAGAESGMDEQAAAYAVLGTDLEALGVAVARHWGLDDAAVAAIRRLPLAKAPRRPQTDDAVLRTVASCAHEAVEALAQPAERQAAAIGRVAQRYARLLGIEARDLRRSLGLPANRREAAPAATTAVEAQDSVA